jgi:hypothetical protein
MGLHPNSLNSFGGAEGLKGREGRRRGKELQASASNNDFAVHFPLSRGVSSIDKENKRSLTLGIRDH